MANIYHYLRRSVDKLLVEVVEVDTDYLWKWVLFAAFAALFGIIILSQS